MKDLLILNAVLVMFKAATGALENFLSNTQLQEETARQHEAAQQVNPVTETYEPPALSTAPVGNPVAETRPPVTLSDAMAVSPELTAPVGSPEMTQAPGATPPVTEQQGYIKPLAQTSAQTEAQTTTQSTGRKSVLDKTADYIRDKYSNDALGMEIVKMIAQEKPSTAIREFIKAHIAHIAEATGETYSAKSNNLDMTKRLLKIRASHGLTNSITDLTESAGPAITPATQQTEPAPTNQATPAPSVPAVPPTPEPTTPEQPSPHKNTMRLISIYLGVFRDTDNYEAAKAWIQQLIVAPGPGGLDPAKNDFAVANVPEANLPGMDAAINEQLKVLGVID